MFFPDVQLSGSTKGNNVELAAAIIIKFEGFFKTFFFFPQFGHSCTQLDADADADAPHINIYIFIYLFIYN